MLVFPVNDVQNSLTYVGIQLSYQSSSSRGDSRVDSSIGRGEWSSEVWGRHSRVGCFSAGTTLRFNAAKQRRHIPSSSPVGSLIAEPHVSLRRVRLRRR